MPTGTPAARAAGQLCIALTSVTALACASRTATGRGRPKPPDPLF